MTQYVITAYDHVDGGLERRLANRAVHLEGIKEMTLAGNFISGGAILDEAGNMVGSSVHVQFEKREELDKWLASDAYATGNVWDNIEVKEIKLFPALDIQKEQWSKES